MCKSQDDYSLFFFSSFFLLTWTHFGINEIFNVAFRHCYRKKVYFQKFIVNVAVITKTLVGISHLIFLPFYTDIRITLIIDINR